MSYFLCDILTCTSNEKRKIEIFTQDFLWILGFLIFFKFYQLRYVLRIRETFCILDMTINNFGVLAPVLEIILLLLTRPLGLGAQQPFRDPNRAVWKLFAGIADYRELFM